MTDVKRPGDCRRGLFGVNFPDSQRLSLQGLPPFDKAYTESNLIRGGNMFRRSILAVLLVFSANFAVADERPVPEAGRGELLYSTHCVACHDTQVHWRDKKLVRDWRSLQAEVRRWQGISALRWSDDDIAVVARYLNALHYRYPAPE